MSEQTIPLRIADLAVAACNAEITKLQEDNARLKASIERLTEAGDAMASDLLSEFGHKEMLKYQPYQEWIAAKEGKTDEA